MNIHCLNLQEKQANRRPSSAFACRCGMMYLDYGTVEMVPRHYLDIAAAGADMAWLAGCSHAE
jgi:hypothetical protein